MKYVSLSVFLYPQISIICGTEKTIKFQYNKLAIGTDYQNISVLDANKVT